MTERRLTIKMRTMMMIKFQNLEVHCLNNVINASYLKQCKVHKTLHNCQLLLLLLPSSSSLPNAITIIIILVSQGILGLPVCTPRKLRLIVKNQK